MSKEERAKQYAKERADSLDEIYTDITPKEWEFEYNESYKYYMQNFD